MVFWDTSKEKEEELIRKAFGLITKYEMEIPAVLFLQTIKPLLWVGGEVSRIVLTPLMIFFWDEGHALIDTFESRKNIEKLIKMLEEKHKKEADKGKEETEKTGETPTDKTTEDEQKSKGGWRRYLRF